MKTVYTKNLIAFFRDMFVNTAVAWRWGVLLINAPAFSRPNWWECCHHSKQIVHMIVGAKHSIHGGVECRPKNVAWHRQHWSTGLSHTLDPKWPTINRHTPGRPGPPGRLRPQQSEPGPNVAPVGQGQQTCVQT